MKCGWVVLILVSILSLAPAEDNMTRSFAEQRFPQISDLAYKLHFEIDPEGDTFRGITGISLQLKEKDRDLVIDFRGGQILSLTLDGRAIENYSFSDEAGRITIPASWLELGPRQLEIAYIGRFSHEGAGFHRFTDPEDQLVYSYTDFEPNDAHRAFPCFDQPDLKATYSVTVLAPEGWEVITNTPALARKRVGDRTHWTFLTSKRFSTYLFNLCVGPYASWFDTSFRIPLGLYARQSMAPYVKVESMFEITRKGFDFFEDYFDHKYAFEKYDQIFVPEFNSGAMENVGAITFSESYLKRREALPSEVASRNEVILHEMAHQWFGNLVTMKWWNDLWLNEAFASYMGYLATAAIMGEETWVYANGFREAGIREDERITTHPILTEVNNVQEAVQIFDGITYGKGLSCLRQLDFFLGNNHFRNGLRHYFRQHAWGNTTLKDFFASLGHVSSRNLDQWSQSWLEKAGINTIQLDYQVVDGKMTNALLLQFPDNAAAILRPHALETALFYEQDGKIVQTEMLRLVYEGAENPFAQLNGRPEPVFMIPDASQKDYIKVLFDPNSLEYLLENVGRIESRDISDLVWRTLWRMVRDCRLSPKLFLEIALREYERENNPLVLDELGDRLTAIVTSYIPDRESARMNRGRIWEIAHRRMEDSTTDSELRPSLFSVAIETATTPGQLAWLRQNFDGDREYPGFSVDLLRKWKILTRLVAMGYPNVNQLVAQMALEDRSAIGKNYQLYLSSLRPDKKAREEAWQRLVDKNSNLSLQELSWLGRGIRDNDDSALDEFIEPYFQYIQGAGAERGYTFMRRFTETMFPSRGDRPALEAANRFLSQKGLDPTLRKMVLEKVDDLARKIRIKEMWEKEDSAT